MPNLPDTFRGARRIAGLWLTVAVATFPPAVAQAQAGQPAPVAPAAATALSPGEWQQAVGLAAAFVDRETPAARLPIDPVRAGSARRRVLADYTPALPISIDGKAGNRDYYSHRLPTGVEPESEAVKHLVIWERPLPAGPWAPRLSDATNAAIEVLRADRIGIDGFLVDLISIKPGSRYWGMTQLLLDAAASSATGFRIAAEPDMDSLRNETLDTIADALASFYHHPAAYKEPDGRLLVVPFRPEARPLAFWQALDVEMKRRGTPIALIAGSLAANSAPAYAPVSIGLSFWGGRDPASALPQLATARRMTSATGLPVMLPVAPQDFRPKTSLFWEARNTQAFRNQWEAAIRSDAPWIHLITWNDYTEGTEIAPSSTIQFLFYDLAAYYIAWYKIGQPPPIRREALFYSFRRQIFDPARTDIGANYRNLGETPLANEVELIGFLRAPGSLEIGLAGLSQRSPVAAGLQTVRLEAAPGTPCFSLLRGGKAAIRLPSPVAIEATSRFKDALYGGGSSLRPYVPVDALLPTAAGAAAGTAGPARPPGGACAAGRSMKR